MFIKYTISGGRTWTALVGKPLPAVAGHEIPEAQVAVVPDPRGGLSVVERADDGLLHRLHPGLKDRVYVLVVEHPSLQDIFLAVVGQSVGV